MTARDEASSRGEEHLLNVEGAARLLKVRPGTVYEWAQRRVIPSIRLGPGRRRTLRFDPIALRAFLARTTTPAREDAPRPLRRARAR